LPERRTLILLIGVLLASALAPLGSTSIAVAMPQIAEFMGMDPGTTTQLLVGGYLLISVVGQAPAGKLGDIIGYQKALYTGLAIFAFGSLLGYLVRSIEALLAARMLMAGASALIVPNASALLRTQLPERLLPFAYGVFGATMGAAAAIGPLLGGALTQLFGWPAIFLTNVPWVLVALGLILATSTKQEEKKDGRLDLRSTMLLALAIGGLQLGFLGEQVDLRFLLPGAVLLCLFLWLQLRIAQPVFNPRFFTRPAFAAASVTTSMGNFTMYALLFQLPIFFSDIRPSSELEIATALTALTLCMMLGGPLAGFAGRLIGARYTALLSAMVNLGGLYLISDMGAINSPADILLPMGMMGFAGGMAGPIVQSAGMLAIDKKDAGMAAGGLSTMRYFGGTIGISILSLQLSTGGATTLPQHLSVIPFYFAALTLVLLAAFLLPVSSDQRKPPAGVEE
jgi:MFS family permease